MQDHVGDITGIAIVAVAALACGIGMRRLGQPAVLGYILAGAILGPSVVGVVENRDAIRTLAELGVLTLLFAIGMELSLRGIREVWKVALITTLLQIAVGLGGMFALGSFLGWSYELSIVIGFVVALSSTAVAVKMLEEIGELRTRVGQVTIGILVAQDLAVVPMMLIVGSFGGEDGIGLDAIAKVILSIAFLALLIVYLSRRQRLRLPFVKSIGGDADLTPLASLAFCFGTAALSGLMGLSPAYGAFLAGLVIGNSTSRRTLHRHTAPIQSILLMVFFLSIGLLIDFRYLIDNIGTVLLIVTFVAIFKTAFNILLIGFLGENWPRAFLSGAILAQLGEFSFILAAIGLRSGALTDEDHRLIVAVTVVSLLGSPFWLETARRLHRITLLGITSGRETVRLTYGKELLALFKSTKRAEHAMINIASSATRWVGDITPRRERSRGVRGSEDQDRPPRA